MVWQSFGLKPGLSKRWVTHSYGAITTKHTHSRLAEPLTSVDLHRYATALQRPSQGMHQLHFVVISRVLCCSIITYKHATRKTSADTVLNHTLFKKVWVQFKVLRPTQHKIGHFGDVPQANLLAWYGKTKPNTTKHALINQKKCTTTQNKHKN